MSKNIPEIKCRPWTYDQFIVDEVFEKWVYNDLTLNEDDIVLDIWANIWAFACYAAPKVKKVVAFEPERENFKQLVINTEGMKVTCNNWAIWGGDEKHRKSW